MSEVNTNVYCFLFSLKSEILSSVMVKLTKPHEHQKYRFMECYCVARNKPIRREISKPQTAAAISLWFRGLLAYPELYCDWPVYTINIPEIFQVFTAS